MRVNYVNFKDYFEIICVKNRKRAIIILTKIILKFLLFKIKFFDIIKTRFFF